MKHYTLYPGVVEHDHHRVARALLSPELLKDVKDDISSIEDLNLMYISSDPLLCFLCSHLTSSSIEPFQFLLSNGIDFSVVGPRNRNPLYLLLSNPYHSVEQVIFLLNQGVKLPTGLERVFRFLTNDNFDVLMKYFTYHLNMYYDYPDKPQMQTTNSSKLISVDQGESESVTTSLSVDTLPNTDYLNQVYTDKDVYCFCKSYQISLDAISMCRDLDLAKRVLAIVISLSPRIKKPDTYEITYAAEELKMSSLTAMFKNKMANHFVMGGDPYLYSTVHVQFMFDLCYDFEFASTGKSKKSGSKSKSKSNPNKSLNPVSTIEYNTFLSMLPFCDVEAVKFLYSLVHYTPTDKVMVSYFSSLAANCRLDAEVFEFMRQVSLFETVFSRSLPTLNSKMKFTAFTKQNFPDVTLSKKTNKKTDKKTDNSRKYTDEWDRVNLGISSCFNAFSTENKIHITKLYSVNYDLLTPEMQKEKREMFKTFFDWMFSVIDDSRLCFLLTRTLLDGFQHFVDYPYMNPDTLALIVSRISDIALKAKNSNHSDMELTSLSNKIVGIYDIRNDHDYYVKKQPLAYLTSLKQMISNILSHLSLCSSIDAQPKVRYYSPRISPTTAFRYLAVLLPYYCTEMGLSSQFNRFKTPMGDADNEYLLDADLFELSGDLAITSVELPSVPLIVSGSILHKLITVKIKYATDVDIVYSRNYLNSNQVLTNSYAYGVSRLSAVKNNALDLFLTRHIPDSLSPSAFKKMPVFHSVYNSISPHYHDAVTSSIPKAIKSNSHKECISINMSQVLAKSLFAPQHTIKKLNEKSIGFTFEIGPCTEACEVNTQMLHDFKEHQYDSHISFVVTKYNDYVSAHRMGGQGTSLLTSLCDCRLKNTKERNNQDPGPEVGVTDTHHYNLITLAFLMLDLLSSHHFTYDTVKMLVQRGLLDIQQDAASPVAPIGTGRAYNERESEGLLHFIGGCGEAIGIGCGGYLDEYEDLNDDDNDFVFTINGLRRQNHEDGGYYDDEDDDEDYDDYDEDAEHGFDMLNMFSHFMGNHHQNSDDSHVHFVEPGHIQANRGLDVVRSGPDGDYLDFGPDEEINGLTRDERIHTYVRQIMDTPDFVEHMNRFTHLLDERDALHSGDDSEVDSDDDAPPGFNLAHVFKSMMGGGGPLPPPPAPPCDFTVPSSLFTVSLSDLAKLTNLGSSLFMEIMDELIQSETTQTTDSINDNESTSTSIDVCPNLCYSESEVNPIIDHLSLSDVLYSERFYMSDVLRTSVPPKQKSFSQLCHYLSVVNQKPIMSHRSRYFHQCHYLSASTPLQSLGDTEAFSTDALLNMLLTTRDFCTIVNSNDIFASVIWHLPSLRLLFKHVSSFVDVDNTPITNEKTKVPQNMFSKHQIKFTVLHNLMNKLGKTNNRYRKPSRYLYENKYVSIYPTLSDPSALFIDIDNIQHAYIVKCMLAYFVANL